MALPEGHREQARPQGGLPEALLLAGLDGQRKAPRPLPVQGLQKARRLEAVGRPAQGLQGRARLSHLRLQFRVKSLQAERRLQHLRARRPFPWLDGQREPAFPVRAHAADLSARRILHDDQRPRHGNTPARGALHAPLQPRVAREGEEADDGLRRREARPLHLEGVGRLGVGTTVLPGFQGRTSRQVGAGAEAQGPHPLAGGVQLRRLVGCAGGAFRIRDGPERREAALLRQILLVHGKDDGHPSQGTAVGALQAGHQLQTAAPVEAEPLVEVPLGPGKGERCLGGRSDGCAAPRHAREEFLDDGPDGEPGALAHRIARLHVDEDVPRLHRLVVELQGIGPGVDVPGRPFQEVLLPPHQILGAALLHDPVALEADLRFRDVAAEHRDALEAGRGGLAGKITIE